jgi:hypothetical protein
MGDEYGDYGATAGGGVWKSVGGSSRPGTGILKSLDSGRTWVHFSPQIWHFVVPGSDGVFGCRGPMGLGALPPEPLSAYYNPKEITVDKATPWKQSEPARASTLLLPRLKWEGPTDPSSPQPPMGLNFWFP